MNHPRFTAILFGFTVSCGGTAFVAGEQSAFDSGLPELDGGSDVVTDKGSTDGGSGLDSAGPDGGFAGPDGGQLQDAGHDAGFDAGVDACFPGATWTCIGTAEDISIPPTKFCFSVYANAAGPAQSVFKAVADPTACDCENTCACILAHSDPCAGYYAYIDCTDIQNGGPVVRCLASGN